MKHSEIQRQIDEQKEINNQKLLIFFYEYSKIKHNKKHTFLGVSTKGIVKFKI